MQKIFLLVFILSLTVVLSAQNKTLDSLKAELQKAKHDTTRLHLYVALGKVCELKDNLLYAEPILKLADKLLAQTTDESQRKVILQQKIQAFYMLNLFYADMNHADEQKEIEYATNAAKIYRELKDTAGMVGVHLGFSRYYLNTGNFPKALESIQKALAISKELNYKTGTATCFLYMADLYRDQKENTQALENYQNALSILSATKDTDMLINAVAAMGGFYYKDHNIQKSLECYHKVIALYEAKKYDNRIGGVYKWIGDLYADNNDKANALLNYEKSLTMAQAAKDSDKTQEVLNVLGKIYNEQGNTAGAVEYHLKALKIAEAMKSEYNKAWSYQCLANAYYSKKNYRLAKQFSELSLEMMKKQFPITELSEAELLAAEIDSATGNGMSALEHYKQYTLLNYKLKADAVHKAAQTEKYQSEYNKQKAEQEKRDAVAQKELQKQKLLRNGFVSGFAVVLLFAGIFFTQRNKISKEKQRSEDLLLNILPAEVAEELKAKGYADAKLFDDVTVLFTDFKSFTTVSERLTPQQLVDELNVCFSAFDSIMGKYNIEKIKTVGDAYLAVSGLPLANPNHAQDVVKAAVEIRDFIKQRRIEKGDDTFDIRIGVHSGSVVAGIVGVKKFAYDIWGDTVNTAARMEQNSEAGKINISQTTYELVKDKFICEYRGEIEAKNKGKLKMYFVN